MSTGDPELDAFLGNVPAMKTSDLLDLIMNSSALTQRLSLWSQYPNDARSIRDAAVVAIKAEIDRRLPIPGEW
jgi:hypothetical protein